VATWSSSLPIAYRLYLPKEWAEDSERREKAEVPKEIESAPRVSPHFGCGVGSD
jgi:SRSO17 transposase